MNKQKGMQYPKMGKKCTIAEKNSTASKKNDQREYIFSLVIS